MLRPATWILAPILFGLPLAISIAVAAELHEAAANIDETVADTQTKVPLRKVTAPIPFENFRYPFVDEAENVIFIGNDKLTFGAKKGNGIYRSQASDGKLEALVTEYDLAPDDGKPIGGIVGLQTDCRSFVFHRGSDHGRGIYARFEDGPLVTVAGCGTIAPGAGTRFEWFWYADVWDDLVVFNASPESRNEWVNGLYLYQRKGGGISRLVDTTQQVTAAGGRLADLSYQPRMDGSWLVFSASRADEKTGNPTMGRGILGWPVTADGNPGTMFAMDRLQVLAPFGMPIPESGGRPLTGAPNPVVGDGLIAVVGGSDPLDWKEETPRWQAICIRTADGKWHNPVDTDTLIPHREDGARFIGFNKWVAIHNGKVVFRAYGPDSYQAVYVFDPADEHLYFVADTTWTVDDKRIAGFEVGHHPMVGKRLAIMIRFNDGTSGEYLATLSGLPTDVVRQAAEK